MPIRIALGGDVNFSKHRGLLSGLVQRKRDPLTVRCWRKLVRMVWSSAQYYPAQNLKDIFADHRLGNYAATQEITDILLEEYGGDVWKNPLHEKEEYDRCELPFCHIGKFFRNADIGHVNLETPLCNTGRHVGMFCSKPEFARVLKDNNITVVSLANNHTFDAGERGFLDTLNVLRDNDIQYVGGGKDIEEARTGVIIETGKVKVGFLGYTAVCNCFFMSLAKKNQPGILPLFEPIVLADISAIRKKCDFLIVAPHFDIENITKIHKKSIEIAHKMIDCGADLIVGNHAHVAKPVELYKGKVIIYCLGSLVFMEDVATWGNSLIAEVVLSDTGNYERVKFYTVNTHEKNCQAPYIIENAEGDRLLSKIKTMSKRKFKTPLLMKKHFLEINSFH